MSTLTEPSTPAPAQVSVPNPTQQSEDHRKQHEQAAGNARQLAQSHLTTVLSTLSKKLKGMPFGSVSPVMLSDEGDVIFYVSDIAQHARNLTADPRLSVTFFNAVDAGDQNEQGRLTLSGCAMPLDADAADTYSERYFRIFPDAISYRKAHDFRFWKLNVEAIRWIGGFGKIYWLDAERWHQPKPEWSHTDEASMVAHMNEDHADACQLICQAALGKTLPNDTAVTQLSVYPDGCHFMVAKQRVFVPFAEPANTGQAVRRALVAMTQAARESKS
ncbi:MAG TPA: DUF2470 domain-containing protein [Marinagarivorans sp.]